MMDKTRSAEAVESVMAALQPPNQLYGHLGLFINNMLFHIGVCNAPLILDSDECAPGLAFL